MKPKQQSGFVQRAGWGLAALIVGALLAPAASLAQNAAPSGQKYTFHVLADEVVLNCTVQNHKGQLVNGLDRSDFRAWDDGKPQSLISVQQTDAPVSIGLLVDDSGSMKTRRPAVTKAALELIRASNPDDQTFVVNFADQAYLDQGFTADLSQLRTSLSHASMMGGTAIYDTVISASQRLENTAQRPRKAIVIITDGDDNASKATLAEAVRQVQNLQGPVIYSIGLLFDSTEGEHAGKARHDLETLSDETGGIAFFPRSMGQVDAIAAEVARAIRNQYTLAYRATGRRGPAIYHTVHVEAKAPGHGRLTVHTRPGYYEGVK